MILETQRLILREMTQADFGDLCEILQDKDAMYAYEHAFSNQEAEEWLARQIARYAEFGFGLWGVLDKQTGELLGQCGLTMQACDTEQVLEIGYLFKRRHWHKGYAIEAAIGCKDYAFQKLNADRVFSIIRSNNLASQRVAQKNGMTVVTTIVKHYYDMEMPHDVYRIDKADYEKQQRA